MTLITLNITKPKTSVHLTPSLDAPREIQVIDFANEGKPIFTLTVVQTMQRIDNGVTLVIISGKHPLKVLQNSLKEVDMGPEIVESNGDWFIRSNLNSNSAKSFTLNLEYQKFFQLKRVTLCSLTLLNLVTHMAIPPEELVT